MSVFKTWDLWRQAYAAAGYVDDEEHDMTTLREAAEAALEALCLPCSRWNGTQSKIVNEAITALRAALVEPPDSTKPVVERNFCPRCGKRANDIHTCTPPVADGDNLSPTEPVAWMDIADDGTRLAVRMYSDGSSEEVPLYTAPQRKPLTDKQKLDLATNWFAEDWAIEKALDLLDDYDYEIERAHGIKE